MVYTKVIQCFKGLLHLIHISSHFNYLYMATDEEKLVHLFFQAHLPLNSYAVQ